MVGYSDAEMILESFEIQYFSRSRGRQQSQTWPAKKLATEIPVEELRGALQRRHSKIVRINQIRPPMACIGCGLIFLDSTPTFSHD